MTRYSSRDPTIILVVSQQLRREGMEVTEILKTRASQRRFAVPRSVGQFLLELKDWREREYGPMGPGDTLICDKDGRPLRHQTDFRHWQKVLETGGLPKYRPHLLRHWAASHLARSGMIENLARGFLGHSDVLMTRSYRIHASDT